MSHPADTVTAPWRQWSKKFASLQLRERSLILLVVVVVFALPGYSWLVEPTLKQQQQTEREYRRMQDQQRGLLTSLEQLSAQVQGDGGQQRLSRERQQLRQAIAEHEQLLREQTIDLIPAERMSSVLEQLLASSGGIKLQQLRSLAPIPLLDLRQADTDPGSNLYQHGIELTLQGRYFDVLRFLQSAERLPWRFYWELLDYRVEEFPRSQVRLVLYTLSTSDKFIGVG